MKNKTTAALLAVFLGGLGIHRFYLGNWIGIVYLLFCWTLIPSVIAFIEFIVFLTMSDAAFNAKYNKDIKLSSVNTADELEKLHALKEKGIITALEFETKKKQLL